MSDRNAAPINAETVRELMDEREMLRAKVERLTAELAASKQENGNLFDRLRMMAQEVTGRDCDIERLEAELAIERERREKAEANGCTHCRRRNTSECPRWMGKKGASDAEKS